MYPSAIHREYGTDFHIALVVYRQLMVAVASSMDASKDAAMGRKPVPDGKLAAMARSGPDAAG